MWEGVLTLALNNGLWAALFCALLVYQLTDSRKREHKLHSIIRSLSDSLQCLKSMEKDIQTIKVSLLKEQS